MFSLEEFQQDGFIVLENFLTNEEIDEMKAECFRLVNEMDPDEHHPTFSTKGEKKHIKDDYFIYSADKVRYFLEELALDENGTLKVDKHLSLNKIGHALHVFCPAFRKVAFSDKMKEVLRHLKYVDPILVQSMYIFKQPEIGGQVSPHQDGSYLFTEPMKGVGIWMALDDADAENGCLSFIPGSHTDGVHGNYRFVTTLLDNGKKTCVYEGTKPTYDPSQFKTVPVKKGSAILIDGLVVHSSEQNFSKKSRHTFTLHFYDGYNTTWDKRNWLQPTSTDAFKQLYNS